MSKIFTRTPNKEILERLRIIKIEFEKLIETCKHSFCPECPLQFDSICKMLDNDAFVNVLSKATERLEDK